MQLTEHQLAPSIKPLETLVVRQIAEMLRDERKLAQRYKQLGGSNHTTAEMSTFTEELSRFEERTKRLMRLMEAMEGCCSPNGMSESAASLSTH